MKRDLFIPLIILCVVALACSFNRTESNSNTAAGNRMESSNSEAMETTGNDVDSESGVPAPSVAESLVVDLYKDHDSNRSPFFQTNDRVRVDRYFTKSTADLIWKDSANSKNEIAAIDFDALYDAQDVEKKNFAVGKAETSGGTATVVATFTNAGERKRITFMLKAVGGSWKIDDIKYSNGNTLAGLLRQYYKAESKTESPKTNAPPVKNVPGDFEGTYRVGETTCTVKPIRMAFEVRWAKGRGSEIFVYQDGNMFESDEGNSFDFTDENYNSGTFYRADGKTFSVSRAR